MARCPPSRATRTLSPQPRPLAMSTLTSCPPPFLDQSAHPYTSGYRHGRFCGPFSSALTCCLPCPTENWFYSDTFEHNKHIAYWFNVPALICQVFLLLTFAVLKKKYSHVHYLSIGLCVSLVVLEVSWSSRRCYKTLRTRLIPDGSHRSSYHWAQSRRCAMMQSLQMISTRACLVAGVAAC